jgi:ATP-dependent Clp protease ATP-binding subunit ClpA
LRYTQASREAFKQTLKSALRLGHNYIGTEHLLLGVSAGDGIVPQAFAAIGLSPDLIDSAVAVEVAEAQLQMRRRAG